MQAQQNLFGLKRRVVDRLLQKKAGNGLGKKRQDTRVLLQAYKEIDANKDGGVSYDEFENAVGPNHLDIGLSKEEVHQLCIACDIDGNGDITFEEFLQTLIFADKPETQLMLDRARKRESKFLQDTVNKPVCVKPIKKIRNSVSTSPLARGGVRTSSSLKDVNSLLNYNDMSNTLVKINGNSKSQPNLSAIVNCPRPMTTSPVRTGCHSPLNPIASLTKRSISTAGTNFKASRNNHGTSNFSFIDDDFDAKNPLETYATMSRQREKHLDPSLNFKSKSKSEDQQTTRKTSKHRKRRKSQKKTKKRRKKIKKRRKKRKKPKQMVNMAKLWQMTATVAAEMRIHGKSYDSYLAFNHPT